MPRINVERKRVGMATVARKDVKPGQVFALVKRDGSLSDKHYLAIGNNGKFMSVNLGNGELASTDNGTSRVAVVGKGQLHVTHSHEHHETTRRALRGNEVFRAKGNGRESSYAALGRLTNGKWASLNLNDPFDRDYAVTDNGDRRVVVLGTYEIKAQVAA